MRDTGARRLWTGQSLKVETHQAFAHLAGAGIRVPVGTGVTLMPLRHPYEAALQARSLALMTGRTVVAGYGVGAPAFVRSLNGRPCASPRTMAADYLRTVRSLIDGEIVDHAGDYHELRGRLIPMDHPGVEVGVGVLRPNMARTAGGVADVAITWMTPPGYVADTLLPALEEGAKDRDACCRVATVVHVAVERGGRDPYVLAHTAAAGHLAADHYTDMLRRAGVPADPADPRAGAVSPGGQRHLRVRLGGPHRRPARRVPGRRGGRGGPQLRRGALHRGPGRGLPGRRGDHRGGPAAARWLSRPSPRKPSP